MLLIHHLVLLCVCAGAGAAVALFLPQWQPNLDNSLALIAGLTTFLVLSLLAEAVSRVQATSRLQRSIELLRATHTNLEDELTWTRREVKAVREALEAAAYSGRLAQGPKAVDEIMNEVQVLKAQISRLSIKAEDTPASRGGEQPAPSDEATGIRLSADDRAPLSEGMALVKRVSKAARRALPALSDDKLLAEVRSALQDDRIEFVLQPIVSLPQRKHRAYECFSRLNTEDGTQLLPEEYIPVAEATGLIAAIDNILLLRCIQLVRRVQQRSRDLGFFCNISSHTLNDEAFFTELSTFLEANAELAPNLVFEFAQSDFQSQGDSEISRLDRLAQLGCRFSLDQVGDLELDADELAQRHVRYVKLDVRDLIDLHDSEDEAQSLARLKESLDRNRIDLIVEKIEDEPSLVELLDYRIDFGQGYLFGEPRPARMAA